jgi:hypothetical protein
LNGSFRRADCFFLQALAGPVSCWPKFLSPEPLVSVSFQPAASLGAIWKVAYVVLLPVSFVLAFSSLLYRPHTVEEANARTLNRFSALPLREIAAPEMELHLRNTVVLWSKQERFWVIFRFLAASFVHTVLYFVLFFLGVFDATPIVIWGCLMPLSFLSLRSTVCSLVSIESAEFSWNGRVTVTTFIGRIVSSDFRHSCIYVDNDSSTLTVSNLICTQKILAALDSWS